MKKILYTLFLLAGLGYSAETNAQILFTEFSYDTPESGNDSLEFVEIYNASANDIDISGYKFLFGSTIAERYTFPANTTLPANEVLVIAVNAAALQRQFNMTNLPLQWTSGSGLSNSASKLVLRDATGATVDSVSYTSATAPTNTNGGGKTAVLCDLTVDNNVMANWSASTVEILNTDNTSRIINGKALFGSPGYLECGLVTVVPPANDDCTAAIMLTQNATCTPTQGTVVDATESLAPCAPWSTVANDVWYSFVATSTDVTITVSNSTMDIAFEVLEGSCNALNNIICVDSNYEGDGEEHSFINLVVGNTYFVRVYENDLGALNSTFDICVTDYAYGAAPTNDECANAVELIPSLTCNPLVASVAGARQSMAEDCATEMGYAADVWYSFVATDTTAIINVQGVDHFDAIIEVFEGDCAALTSIVCADDAMVSASNTNVLETLTVATTVGETYYVRVYDYYGPMSITSDFSICVIALDPIQPCDTTNLVLTLDGCGINHEVTAVTGGLAPYTYAWSTGDATAAITGLVIGETYTVTVTDANACQTTQTFVQDICNSIDQIASGFNMNVYPNPAKSAAVLSLQTTNTTDLSIELVNVMGQVISSQVVVNNGTMTYALPIENLSAGVYFVKVSSKEGVATKQLIIAK